MIEDLRLAGLRLWDESLVENIKNVLTDFLKLGLDLLAIIADGADVLVRTF